jgi:hypothetical protein
LWHFWHASEPTYSLFFSALLTSAMVPDAIIPIMNNDITSNTITAFFIPTSSRFFNPRNAQAIGYFSISGKPPPLKFFAE